MERMTLKQFNESKNALEYRTPFIVAGVCVVKLNRDTFAKCDYVNPHNTADFLAGVEMTAKQIYNSIADDNARAAYTH